MGTNVENGSNGWTRLGGGCFTFNLQGGDEVCLSLSRCHRLRALTALRLEAVVRAKSLEERPCGSCDWWCEDALEEVRGPSALALREFAEECAQSIIESGAGQPDHSFTISADVIAGAHVLLAAIRFPETVAHLLDLYDEESATTAGEVPQ